MVNYIARRGQYFYNNQLTVAFGPSDVWTGLVLEEELALVSTLLRETYRHGTLAVTPIVRECERRPAEWARYWFRAHTEHRIEYIVRGYHRAHLFQTRSLWIAPAWGNNYRVSFTEIFS